MDDVAFDRSVNMNDTPRYVTYLIMHHFHLLVLNGILYFQSKGWSELLSYVLKLCQVSQMCKNLLKFVKAEFELTYPSPFGSSAIALDEHGVPVNQPFQSIPLVGSLYANRIVLDTDGRWVSVRRPTQATTLKRSPSPCSSAMMWDLCAQMLMHIR